jgi:predicted trehalose synthase
MVLRQAHLARREVGVQLDRALERLSRLVVATELQERTAEVVQRPGELGLEPERCWTARVSSGESSRSSRLTISSAVLSCIAKTSSRLPSNPAGQVC